MLAGPIFAREWLITPRQLKHYVTRAGYAAALLVLMYTAGVATFGFQRPQNPGEVAAFGKFVFSVFAVVHLLIVSAAALLLGSANVAHEKDRRTLILLLMTDLRNRELVLGKLFAGLLTVFVIILVSLPVFSVLRILGGVSLGQVLWLEMLCLASALVAGSWGSLVAFWRDKTFQTLAISVLGLVLFLGLVEGVAAIFAGSSIGAAAELLNPLRALGKLLDPLSRPDSAVPNVSVWPSVCTLLALSAVLTSVTIARLRVWNPSKSVHESARSGVDGEAKPVRKVHRQVSDEPVAWREICTRAYGRKTVVIKAAYILFAILVGAYLWTVPGDGGLVLGMISREGFAFVALSIIALLLINAQAVTALTTERDGLTLELLLATEITPREFVTGKLEGVLYNTWQVTAVPLAFLIVSTAQGNLSLENAIYVLISFLTLVVFSAMLGLHSGLGHANSRAAIANSLGTMFFLFVGIFICLMLVVEARASLLVQLPAFLVFILGGSIGLMVSLRRTTPSPALLFSALLLPFMTFYALTGFLIGNTLGICCVLVGMYGFTTIAMLVPAVSEFDLALGRSSGPRE
ncbi:MAG: ABC transporter permease [Planctomycetota bacterium]|nr:MAG: ABC transporter permease [Planctomycetota bacterium]REJ87399.1 MAG: ABC transporter permease [Planctomycetota bacterium]REK27412.1 MAG: ABC transporter permease [Planctomycetota bacterium]REK36909.1 MAG: ABC transporter permease [Planctomycetota bacterium]